MGRKLIVLLECCKNQKSLFKSYRYCWILYVFGIALYDYLTLITLFAAIQKKIISQFCVVLDIFAVFPIYFKIYKV